VKLHHRLDGPDGAPLLVLGPSLGTTLDIWRPQLPALTRSWRVLRYDLPGHGGSPPAEGFSIDDLARAVLELTEEPRFALGGLSLGGAIAATAALQAPERIRSLVLCCTAARFGEPGPWLGRAALVRGKGLATLTPLLAARWFTAGYDGQWALDMLEQVDAESYAACCVAVAAFDLTRRLSEITAPTLVVAGADDPATPLGDALILATGIPGALLAPIPGAAHLASVQRADAVTPAITHHLSAARAREHGAGTAGEAHGRAVSSGAEGPADLSGQGGPAAPAAPAGQQVPVQAGAGPRGREAGTRTRREVLGNAHVDRADATITDLTRDFQDFITRYAWDEIWNRQGLDRRTRSCVTLTALVAGGHLGELGLHVRAALRNGLTRQEIGEVLLQTAVYCGVPAANAAFAVAQRTLAELDAQA